MLYLSGSLGTAYTEIFPDKALHEFTYAKFRNKKELYLWDMCFPDSWPGVSTPFEFYRFFIFFALFLACSIDVLYEGGSYKPEYALPQLFTQFIKSYRYPLVPNGRLDGICYLPPTMGDGVSRDCFENKNYAFVVDGASFREGYDNHLAEKFTMTAPKRFKATEYPDIIKIISDYIDQRDLAEPFNDIDLK
jgi:hypothetical protein